MDQKSLKSVRQRRSYTPEFKAELVAQYLDGDDSLASLAVDHGMNPKVLHRWVREHERYGKHSLGDLDADSGGALVTRAPTNWIPLTPSPGTTDARTVTPAPTKTIGAESSAPPKGTIALELAAKGLRLTIDWPVAGRRGLASFVRELLT